ncbi:MAG: hypothetical protein RRY64_06605 [Oscillospiraceae bacterium]
MRLIDADALMTEIDGMSITISGSAKDSVIIHIATQPTIDAVAKDKVITCVTGIIEGYSDAHVITCTVCGLPFPDYEVEEMTECRWCKAKSHSKAYAPSWPGYCKTSEDRKAKTFDKLFSAPTIDAVPVVHGRWEDVPPFCTNCGAKMDAAGENL